MDRGKRGLGEDSRVVDLKKKKKKNEYKQNNNNNNNNK